MTFKSVAKASKVCTFSIVGLVLVWSLAATEFALAHDDLDLSIESVTLNDACKVEIIVKNVGYDLPDSFYNTVNPAFLTIKKGERSESLKSLRALDKHKQLQKLGGSLKVLSQNSYASIPAAITVQTQYAPEFGDYGSGNNQSTLAMDCIVGKGQIEGAPIVFTQPDVAVTDARIDPLTCKMSITLENLTGVPLDSDSWSEESGVAVMRLNLQSNQLAPEIPLRELDPSKSFGKKGVPLVWIGPIPFSGAQTLRIGLWRVRGDLNFSNNTTELAVPNACAEPQ